MSNWQEFWRERREREAWIHDRGGVVVRWAGSRLHVTSPKNHRFIAGALALGGTWRYRSRVWSFVDWRKPEVLQLIKDVYGEQALTKRWRDQLES